MRFRPEQHLRRQSDFRAVREQGRRIDCGAFTLWCRARAPGEQPAAARPRLGVVASIASVGKATERTRAKRRLRALFRDHQELLPANCDLLLSARARLNQLEYAAVAQTFVAACQRAFPKS